MAGALPPQRTTLPSQHGHLVSQDDHFDGKVSGVPPLQAKELEDPDKSDVQKQQAHRSSSSPRFPRIKSLLRVYGCILGTHTTPRHPTTNIPYDRSLPVGKKEPS